MKCNTSISEEINKDTKITGELNKKKEQILGNITTPKISNSTIRQNRCQNSLFEKTKDLEGNIPIKKSDSISSNNSSNQNIIKEVKISKKMINSIRDIEKSSPFMSSSYFKPKLNNNGSGKNLHMSNLEFKSKKNFKI